MTDNQSATRTLLEPLESPSGGYTMLALDQRESLRRMFPAQADGTPVTDETLRGFKADAIELLSAHASGILLDRPFAVTTDRPENLASDRGLILAVDVLEQPAGRAVINTTLDSEATVDFIQHVGAVAIKLLVIWHPGRGIEERAALVRDFVDLAERAGVASLVEGIVRPDDDGDWPSHAERHEAIVAAARELSALGGSIYKGEVPGYVPGDVSAVRQESERVTAAVDGPWVVLSNGVALEDFADAVREACRGGARGFLAGRAIWSDTVSTPDPRVGLRDRSTRRLQELTDIVADAIGA
ncbi:aldolase [Mycetocola tolaasinivorans]|uniref:Aldolase n=1 Tax=Mycetocola tolaasinivorans TaxID=76635 RepID=A0A3L7A6Y3_9MICO|nr:aldolase [Mycetocola tolaasinivorans]RLP75600.1 aldolase [Mycetocola tolaasinivorans]